MNQKITSMPKSELAYLYFPYAQFPVRIFMRWVHQTPVLMRELQDNHYTKTQKNLLAVQVAIIRKHLGDPEITTDQYKYINNEVHKS